MAGPIMFVVAFLVLLGWGIFNKRRLPPWWPADEPSGVAALRLRFEALSREIGERLLPAMNSLTAATAQVVDAFVAFGAAFGAAFTRKEQG